MTSQLLINNHISDSYNGCFSLSQRLNIEIYVSLWCVKILKN